MLFWFFSFLRLSPEDSTIRRQGACHFPMASYLAWLLSTLSPMYVILHCWYHQWRKPYMNTTKWSKYCFCFDWHWKGFCSRWCEKRSIFVRTNLANILTHTCLSVLSRYYLQYLKNCSSPSMSSGLRVSDSFQAWSQLTSTKVQIVMKDDKHETSQF